MPNLFNLLSLEDAHNGTRALLEEIRKHQPDMPPEMQNDSTFGALVVLYDLGKARAKRLQRLEKWSMVYGGLLLVTGLAITALHSEVPWLTGLLERLFGG
jgi:thiosulfate reductase cytochrome b subunit